MFIGCWQKKEEINVITAKIIAFIILLAICEYYIKYVIFFLLFKFYRYSLVIIVMIIDEYKSGYYE